MAAQPKKRPLQTSNDANIPTAPAAAAAGGKTIEETYQKLSQLEHILLRPDTYIGSIEKHVQPLWVYNENNEMEHRPVTYVPGLYKIFDEILVNAADNKQRDPSMNSLKVTIDVEENLITIYNNGDGVPVEIHQEEKVYVPELIFGHLLTSSNYNDNVKKTTGGRNGYGAKLTNIFSTQFVIETADSKRQKKYKQVFSNNMGKKSEPVITKCKAGENWTKVSFKPDLEKFKMSYLEEDVVSLMRKRVVDMAGCLGKTVKVELNGHPIGIKSFLNYADLYLKSAGKFRTEPLPRIHAKIGDRWEICVSRSEGHFQQVSFVNSIATIKGGTHVDYITGQITAYIAKIVNKKKKHANLKPQFVKNYLWVFVNALIDNPAFDSQTKETLTTQKTSFGSDCDVPESVLKDVANSGVVDALLSWADFKSNKDLKKTDGKKREKLLGIPKLEDANEAGKRQSQECTLILTEGDSAKALAMAGLSVVGRDHYGVFPLRGKLLNVREASNKQIKDNEEIQHIKQILGLKQDKEYTAANLKELRYGHLMIMADQDYDGSHIKGLLINFIHSFWPSLLKVPSFMVEFTTPIIRATHSNGTKLSFYSMPEYESWKESLGHNAKGWTIKYYKGLGTSTPKEGREYFGDLDKHMKEFVWEADYDGNAIEMAFSKKKAEDRKTWIRNFEPRAYRDHREKRISYSDFVNKELILFSRADLQRSIPSVIDGLKPGQRKILFCSFKKKLFKETKVAQFVGYVSEQSAYHHGEQSLSSTIIGMAQDFVGSNNINLLKPNGQFGTRNLGGKDHASARYIFTELNPITRCLFHEDDDNLLEYLNEDGKSIEPNWYIPIIPLVLVNGSEGIGTGWSSYIPNYNPRDIIANVRRLMDGETMIPMDPWYRGYKGIIEKSAKEGGYVVNGMIEEKDEQTFRITELPIRKWTQDYKQFLESVTDGSPNLKEPLLEDFRQNGDDAIVDIEVRMKLDKIATVMQEGLLKKFKLTSTISTSNMHLFDAEGKIRKYDNPEQILEEFFPLRLEYYERRKKFKLDTLERLLVLLDNKVRFILGVVNGEIVVSNRRKAELLAELKQKGFTPLPRKGKSAEPQVAGANDENSEEQEPESARVEEAKAGDYEYLLSMPIGTLTLESVQKLLAEKDEKANELEILKATPSKSMWMKDLDELEKKLDELDRKEAEEEQKRASQAHNRASNRGVSKVSTKAPKKPAVRKNKKAKNVEPEATSTSNSSTEVENAAEVAKPKGRAGYKKAPAKMVDELGEEVILSLGERLTLHNNGAPSGETFADLETEEPTVQVAKKQYTKRGGAKKKPSSSTVLEISDSDGENNVDDNDSEDDEDFEIQNPAAPEAGKKNDGRKPVAQNAKKPPAATKKRGVGNKQTLITRMLKPAAESSGNSSPEKKVRKMRESPFNKKSGSILGRAAGKNDETASEDMAMGSASNSPSNEEEVVEVAPAAARARPQRANRTQARYVVIESESENDEVDEDGDDATEDSDFDGDGE